MKHRLRQRPPMRRFDQFCTLNAERYRLLVTQCQCINNYINILNKRDRSITDLRLFFSFSNKIQQVCSWWCTFATWALYGSPEPQRCWSLCTLPFRRDSRNVQEIHCSWRKDVQQAIIIVSMSCLSCGPQAWCLCVRLTQPRCFTHVFTWPFPFVCPVLYLAYSSR